MKNTTTEFQSAGPLVFLLEDTGKIIQGPDGPQPVMRNRITFLVQGAHSAGGEEEVAVGIVEALNRELRTNPNSLLTAALVNLK